MYPVTRCVLHPEIFTASLVICFCLTSSIIGRLASTLFRLGYWSLSTSRAPISPRMSVTEFWMENFFTEINTIAHSMAAQKNQRHYCIYVAHLVINV